MPNNLKSYDFPQVIRSVFDVDKNCLRVCLVEGGGGGGSSVEVIIDHTNDSIRLGDGTNFFSSTTIGGKIGLDINQINASVGVSGNTDALSMGAANSEQNYVLPLGTKWFRFRSSEKGSVSYGYSTGQLNFTVMPGNSWLVKDLNLLANTTVYFSSTKTGDVLEIEYWT